MVAIWAALSVMIAVAGVAAVMRTCRVTQVPGLSDQDLKSIEAGMAVELDEGLDLEEIREEEEAFWGETWDQPEDSF